MEESPNARRTGLISLSEGDIRNLLDLPEGYRIRSIQGSFDPPRFVLLVESPTLPTVPYDAESPFLDGTAIRATKYDPADDKRWSRWEWRLG
jgi:hypothetical protein